MAKMGFTTYTVLMLAAIEQLRDDGVKLSEQGWLAKESECLADLSLDKLSRLVHNYDWLKVLVLADAIEQRLQEDEITVYRTQTRSVLDTGERVTLARLRVYLEIKGFALNLRQHRQVKINLDKIISKLK
jgi:hypothetical protein